MCASTMPSVATIGTAPVGLVPEATAATFDIGPLLGPLLVLGQILQKAVAQ